VITGIDHLAVVTTDLERAARFYKEVLGFRETGRLQMEDGGTIVFIALDSTNLELFGGGKPKEEKEESWQAGLAHIALAVDDVDGEYERISSHGVQFTMKPTSAIAGLRIAFFKDLDGNVLELVQRPK